MTRRWVADETGASAGLELLGLALVAVFLAPFAVAAADVPTGADDVDAAAAAAARVAATQRDPVEARGAAVRTATVLLSESRCTPSTIRVEPDVERFEPIRRSGRLPEPGRVVVTVTCTIETGKRLGLPWLKDSRVVRSAEEDVDPFRSDG